MTKEQEELRIWRNFIKSTIEKYIFPTLNEENSILDIGIGDSADIVQNKFSHAKILDKRNVSERIDFVADITNLTEEDESRINKFDFIFLCEVLEHTETPWTVEKNIKKILKPKGKVFVSVPCFLWWHPGGSEYNDNYRFLPGHIPSIFPNMHKINEWVEPNDQIRPLGMCYVLENK